MEDTLQDNFILQPPIFHPVIPYVTTIFGGLYAGKMVMMQGTVPHEADRFQIDFQCGCSLWPRPDIAIHFNPRFHSSKPHVVCNTLHGGRWLQEDRWPGLGLQRGASFLLLFLFEREEVKVSVNGQHFLHYTYRLPLPHVDTLGVFGDIMVKAVGFLNSNPFVASRPDYPIGHPLLLKNPRLQVPFSCLLPHGLGSGQVITVRGLVCQEPKEFVLSLQADTAHHPVRLRADFRDRTLAWTSPQGQEERVCAPFIFHPQRFFEVLLLAEEGRCRLAMNGNALGEFSPGPLGLQQPLELQIRGSVELYSVQC
ncbi:galectin-12 isoform X1 [Tachyglossus aculeatus]|uniref:galectin-12 isoform X1 n=2 Tax=Tachyglossus aculeatus TaxID=9261 RepID=UPI0018F767BF|nr:galectin-12 isoform X1 [Tachyglossus aculeatus]